MAKQYRILRKIATVQIQAGSFATVQMPMNYDYEAIGLRINASLQVTVGGSAVRAEAPCQLIPRVELTADGKNTIISAPGWYGSLGNYLRSAHDQGARATVPPTNFTAATYAVEGNLLFDLIQPDTVRPKDTAFRSKGLSLLELRLTFGQPADCFVGATVQFSGTPTVDIFSMEIVEEMANGQFIDKPLALTKISYQELPIPASNAQFQADLPAGNSIRSVFIRTEGAVTAGEPSTAILNAATLQNGIDVRMNMTGPTLRNLNNMQFGQLTGGYYIADFVSQGQGGANMLGNLWDVSGRTQPQLVADVVGGANNRMQVVTKELIFAA